ncbi:probable RNA methyltransferase CG11342 [Eurosta solidaginis]|uniref:probable RNA methyltransferase CG11342 n=1 Tax=Eurosta solidaginis TaxID=178769 RepID=UPI00353100E2
MEFRNNDPGAVQYGNFINYYQFNNAQQRLELLPRDVWLRPSSNRAMNESYSVLDVGCNAGNLTQLMYEFLKECLGPNTRIQMLGIDIDEDLIKRAEISNEHCTGVSYVHLNIMNEEAYGELNEYLSKHGRCKFDAIFCLSITMWIHLNHGDDELQTFLQKLSGLAELLVVEPQPWKCYQTAVRRMKKAGEEFPLFKELQWRSSVEDNINKFLEGKMGRKMVYECLPTRWQRRICFFR